MQRVPIGVFLAELEAAYKRGDGYIMGAYGQNPKTGYHDLSKTDVKAAWQTNGHMYGQYTGNQRTKALYWRAHCVRVWDCNGLAEGIYQIHTGVSINAYARTNYATWCGVKGSGIIPANRRVPGAAVFWGSSAGAIHHVAYLYKPVVEGHPEGDWYLIEARGVMYGVVRTTLMSRRPNYWGIMDRYFDYGATEGSVEPLHLGARTLRNGDEGDDVKELQAALIELGFNLGRWGADGDFGDCTEMAVKAFQMAESLAVDGVVGPKTVEALTAALAEDARSDDVTGERVRIAGGSCYVRKGPGTEYGILGAVTEGTELPYGGEIAGAGWLLVEYKGQNGWVSPKYGKMA